MMCALVFIWALEDTRRALSCPFQFAAASLVFILPQLVILELAKPLPAEICWPFALYCILAFAAVLFGHHNYNPPPLRQLSVVNERRLVNVAGFTTLAGFTGVIGLQIYLRRYGEIRGLWTGWPVYFYTLSKLLVPSLVLWRLLYVFRKRQGAYKMGLLVSIPFFFAAVINGRRSWALMFAFSWFLPLLLTRQLRLKTWHVIAFNIFAFLVITLFPAYRQQLRNEGIEGLKSAILARSPADVLREYFSGDQTLEVADGIRGFAAVQATGRYSYGLRFWDCLVHTYVPGTLIGHESKNKMKTVLGSYSDLTRTAIQDGAVTYTKGAAFYTAKTGFLDSFAEFSWFGLVLYYFLGRYYKRLYVNAVERSDEGSIIVLAFIAFVPSGIVYGEWAFILTTHLPLFVIAWMSYKRCAPRSEASDGRKRWGPPVSRSPSNGGGSESVGVAR